MQSKDNILRIRLMGNFAMFLNEDRVQHNVLRSHKGMELLQFLMMHRGKSVSNQVLLDSLWGNENSANPENALKTLISRLRPMLNQVMPGLGFCIVADRGAYHWENLPNIQIDMYEVEDLLNRLELLTADSVEYKDLMSDLLRLYKGDLMREYSSNEIVAACSTALHNRYMSAIYNYIAKLREEDNYNEIAAVCRIGLDVDAFDDKLHIELMNALVKTNRASDALAQYKYAVNLNYQYLGIRPSDNIQEFYKHIYNAGKSLDFNLESIRRELKETDSKQGAFVCEYVVFKEIYNLQMRNLERLGSTMMLAIVQITSPDGEMPDTITQNAIWSDLVEIMRTSLRKGDTITHVSPTIFALLLPMVSPANGTKVMERIKRAFYLKYSNSTVCFDYRVGPLLDRPDDAPAVPGLASQSKKQPMHR